LDSSHSDVTGEAERSRHNPAKGLGTVFPDLRCSIHSCNPAKRRRGGRMSQADVAAGQRRWSRAPRIGNSPLRAQARQVQELRLRSKSPMPTKRTNQTAAMRPMTGAEAFEAGRRAYEAAAAGSTGAAAPTADPQRAPVTTQLAPSRMTRPRLNLGGFISRSYYPSAFSTHPTRGRPAWEVNRRLSIKDLCVQGVDTRQPNPLIPRGRSSNPPLVE
jgi:hypothetical protein